MTTLLAVVATASPTLHANHFENPLLSIQIARLRSVWKKACFSACCQENILDHNRFDRGFGQYLSGFRDLKIAATMDCGILALCVRMEIKSAFMKGLNHAEPPRARRKTFKVSGYEANFGFSPRLPRLCAQNSDFCRFSCEIQDVSAYFILFQDCTKSGSRRGNFLEKGPFPTKRFLFCFLSQPVSNQTHPTGSDAENSRIYRKIIGGGLSPSEREIGFTQSGSDKVCRSQSQQYIHFEIVFLCSRGSTNTVACKRWLGGSLALPNSRGRARLPPSLLHCRKEQGLTMNGPISRTEDEPDSLQRQIEARGLEIFARMREQKPGGFGKITGRLMDWSMQNESLKVQLFRFVDVLPTLHSSGEIARHAQEYLGGANKGLPALVRWGVRVAPKMPWLVAFAARRGVAQMGGTFILARNGAGAVPALKEMRRLPLTFTMDILGETAVSEIEAAQYQARYLELIESLARETEHWPLVEQIDADDRGRIPRVNISVKLSALFSQIHPADPETAVERISARLLPLLLAAKQRGVFVNFDMESTALKDVTLAVFKRLLDEPALQDFAHAGIAFQAYLRDSERDFGELLDWAKSRRRRITIRLIKGAYWDYETLLAGQREWPVPVFQNKAETDANYEKLARRMLENPGFINCAFATHNVRSAAACIVHAEKLGLSPRSFEFQMLHGMAEPIKLALAAMGYRVRDYCPVGEVLPGMSYLVRRLLENTSNEGFLRATFNERVAPDKLLRDPAEVAGAATNRRSEGFGNMNEDQFRNEPLTDFKVADNRRLMLDALQAARKDFGRNYPLVIGGRELWTERQFSSINPAQPDEIIGRVARPGTPYAEEALAAAGAAFPKWSRTSVDERARVLEQAAALMRRERFDLAALEVFETGKPWIEADADVAEAIDFCNFYAREMRRLGARQYSVPGETSSHHYIPRGIAAVIAPWNFPLAILCGMTAAAMVAGNTVIMKPAIQSSVVAWRLMDILQRAGAPPGVVNFLPGPGDVLGPYLVEHPDVSLIAFTGSRRVGLGIFETAGRLKPGQKQLKHVICEMGGKNALIVDTDADVDEAIPAIIYSAFGYQGQKCSALSRLIVLADNYDRVLARLIEACRDLKVGPPVEPGTTIGPVIDKAAYDRIMDYIAVGKEEGKLAFQGQRPPGEGYYIPPTIFTDVPPTARIAQEEIFGPVLCVFKAENLDEALALANGTEYALTGGIFSRSPANIERVKLELEAGNVYINRGITGAMVARHPFGGFKMSGGGTKAGGRDYLLHFLLPRVVTENDMRRGFAPEKGAHD